MTTTAHMQRYIYRKDLFFELVFSLQFCRLPVKIPSPYCLKSHITREPSYFNMLCVILFSVLRYKMLSISAIQISAGVTKICHSFQFCSGTEYWSPVVHQPIDQMFKFKSFICITYLIPTSIFSRSLVKILTFNLSAAVMILILILSNALCHHTHLGFSHFVLISISLMRFNDLFG